MENTAETTYSLLLQELAKVCWYPIHGNHYDDHKLERTFLHNQLGVFYVRKADNIEQIYTAKGNDLKDVECLKCGKSALSIQIVHTIMYALFPLSGSGKSSYETAHYCPTCEEKPNPNGTPIGTST